MNLCLTILKEIVILIQTTNEKQNHMNTSNSIADEEKRDQMINSFEDMGTNIYLFFLLFFWLPSKFNHFPWDPTN